MTAPVINSATLDKSVIAPGQSAVLTVVASDADTRAVDLNITGTDADGTNVTGHVTLNIGDPVSLSVVCADPKVQITPMGGGKFTVAVLP